MKHLILVYLAVLSASGASEVRAEVIKCHVYSMEDISVRTQHRQRIFVATASPMPDKAMALGNSIAAKAVMSRGLDFVDVFVTRLQDGMNREDHNMITALAWVRFNPGNTPVIKTRLEGQAVMEAVRGRGEMAIITAPRRDVTGTEITEAYLDHKFGPDTFSCVR